MDIFLIPFIINPYPMDGYTYNIHITYRQKNCRAAVLPAQKVK